MPSSLILSVCRLDTTTDRLSRAEKELKQVRQARADQQHHDFLEQACHSGDQQTYRMAELEGRLGHIFCHCREPITGNMVTTQLGVY